MDRRSAFVAAAFLGVVLAAFAPVARAAAQGATVATFADWAVTCERTVGAPADDCAATQSATAESDASVTLTAYFVREASGAVDTLRIVAPLGVLLPSGLGLAVDGEEVGVAGFVRCLPPGCISEVALTETLRAELVAGERATFSVSLPARQVGVSLSLAGLADALAALRTASLDDGAGGAR